MNFKFHHPLHLKKITEDLQYRFAGIKRETKIIYDDSDSESDSVDFEFKKNRELMSDPKRIRKAYTFRPKPKKKPKNAATPKLKNDRMRHDYIIPNSSLNYRTNQDKRSSPNQNSSSPLDRVKFVFDSEKNKNKNKIEDETTKMEDDNKLINDEEYYNIYNPSVEYGLSLRSGFEDKIILDKKVKVTGQKFVASSATNVRPTRVERYEVKSNNNPPLLPVTWNSAKKNVVIHKKENKLLDYLQNYELKSMMTQDEVNAMGRELKKIEDRRREARENQKIPDWAKGTSGMIITAPKKTKVAVRSKYMKTNDYLT